MYIPHFSTWFIIGPHALEALREHNSPTERNELRVSARGDDKELWTSCRDILWYIQPTGYIYIYIFVFIFIYTYTCRYAYMCIHIYMYTNKWDCLKIGYPHFQMIYICIYIYCWIGYPSSLGFRAGFGRAEAAYLHKSSPFLVGCHPQNARCMALGLPVYHGLPHNFSS